MRTTVRDQRHRVGLARRSRRGDRRHGSRGTVTAKSEPASSSPVVPFICPKQRSTAVANGQQRSAAIAPELCHPCRWAVDGASQACGTHRGWAALGPRTIGNPWSSADNSGKQSRRSEPMPVNRCRSRYRPSGSLKATVSVLSSRRSLQSPSDPQGHLQARQRLDGHWAPASPSQPEGS